MNLNDYQHLETIAAKNGAIQVDAADLLAWREEMARLKIELADHEVLNENCRQYHSEVERLRQVKLWAQQAYQALVYINAVGPVTTFERLTWGLIDSAPEEVKG